MNKMNWIFAFFVVALVPMFANALCTANSALSANGTDYFNVQLVNANTTAMYDWQTWSSWNFFTVRLNFTKPVWETITVGADGTNTTPKWSTYVNSSLIIINGSGDVIDVGNYSFVWTGQAGGDWVIRWKGNWYNGSTANLTFNRTFVKNVDDLVNGSSDIYSGSTKADWLVENTPTEMGADKTFYLANTYYGKTINSTNWAVGWIYRDATCDTSVCTGVNGTIVNVLLTIFLVGLLVFLGLFAYNGALDTKVVVGVVVAFIFALVALGIIKGLLTSLCLGV